MKTTALRSIQTLLAVSSFFLLTGAKGEGCGTSVVIEPPPPPPPLECPMGSHIVTVCEDSGVIGAEESTTSSSSGSSSGGFGGGSGGASSSGGPDEPPIVSACHDECIPDDSCPPGMIAEWTCSGGGADPDAPVCEGEGCPVPPPCELVCIPAECPPGMHSELICGTEDIDYGSSSSSSSSSGGGDESPPFPGECMTTCVDDACPPGTVPVETCEESCDGMATCWITCAEVDYAEGE